MARILPPRAAKDRGTKHHDRCGCNPARAGFGRPNKICMKTKIWNVAILVLILTTGLWSTGRAEQPLNVLQQHISSCLAILKDPQFASPQHKAIQLSK